MPTYTVSSTDAFFFKIILLGKLKTLISGTFVCYPYKIVVLLFLDAEPGYDDYGYDDGGDDGGDDGDGDGD